MSVSHRRHAYAAVALCVCLTLTACGGKESRIAKHLSRAQEYIATADYARARVELKNVLQIDPKRADAYFLAGQLSEKENDWNAAYANYEKAVEVSPQFWDARVRLARVFLLYGEVQKAEQTLQSIPAEDGEKENVRLVRAAMQAAAGREAAAIEETTKVLEQNPGHEDAASLLAGVYSKVGDTEKALTTLANGAKANPNSVTLRLDLANLLLRSNQVERAEAPLKEICAIEPQHFDHQLRLAAYYSSTNKLDEAEQILRGGTQAAPSDEKRQLALVEFLARKRAPDAAVQSLEQYVAAHSDALDAQFALADLYFSLGQLDKAEKTHRTALDQAKTDLAKANATRRLAEHYLARGMLSESQALIEQLLRVNARDDAALLIRSKISIARGQAGSAIADLRSLIKSQPDSVEYLSLLARAHVINREPALAKESLAQAVERNPQNPQARLLWVDYLALSGDYTGALKEVNEAIKVSPMEPSLFQLKASIEAASKNNSAAEKTLAQLATISGDQALVHHRLGSLHLANQKYEAAITEFEIAIQKSPRSYDSLAGSTKALIALGQTKRAQERIHGFFKDRPNIAQESYLIGEVLAAQGDHKAAQEHFRAAIADNPKWQIPYLSLRSLLSAEKNFSAAEEILRRGLEVLPGDPALTFALARVFESAGQAERAIAQYEALLKSHPQMDIAANNLAVLLAERSNDKDTLKRALELASRFENSLNPIFLDTLGWVLVNDAQHSRGLELLARALQASPDNPEFNYHVGVAKLKLGDTKGAKQHLRVAAASETLYTGLSEAKRLLAML